MQIFVSFVFFIVTLSAVGGQAQNVLMSREDADRMNAGRVGIVTGSPTGTYIRIGRDLATVLDDGATYSRRIVVKVGSGSIGNLRDLLYLRNVDAAIVQSDVLAFFQVADNETHRRLQDEIAYVTPLYNEEVHILARSEITDVRDLDGRVVSIGALGGGTSITARNLFGTVLGIAPDYRNFAAAEALDKLIAGEIDAMVFVAGKPISDFGGLSTADARDIRFLPLNPSLIARPGGGGYRASRFTAEDYPALIAPGRDVPTLGVPAVLAVYNWSPNATNPTLRRRYNNTRSFVTDLFDNIRSFGVDGMTEKWCEVDVSQDLRGWMRFAASTEWLANRGPKPVRPDCAPALAAAPPTMERAALDPANPCFAAFLTSFSSMADAPQSEQRPLFDLWLQQNPGAC